jgi:negative regulator of sigma E activity
MDNNDTPISIAEHLSAVFDDEAGSFEQKRVLDELESNQELRQKLSCYALIGETMRSGELDKPVVGVSKSFLAGIHEKIDADDEYHDVIVHDHLQNKQTRNDSKSWLRPVGGFAIAASVVAIAVLGMQNYGPLSPAAIETASSDASSNTMNLAKQKDQSTEREMNSAIVMPANTMIATNDGSVEDTEQYKQADARTRSLLKRYVDSHMQYASTASFVPSVRAIAYTDNQ